MLFALSTVGLVISAALNFRTYQTIANATFVGRDQVLFNMKDVRVVYQIADDCKQVVTEDAVKEKFELTLRLHNVPTNPSSQNVLILAVDGFYAKEEQATICFLIELACVEQQLVLRGRALHTAKVRIWSSPLFGTVGKSKASEDLLGGVEKLAETFANSFLAANPQKK